MHSSSSEQPERPPSPIMQRETLPTGERVPIDQSELVAEQEQERIDSERKAAEVIQNLHLTNGQNHPSAPILQKKITDYQEKYIPDYLKKPLPSGSWINKSIDVLIGHTIKKVGEENIPPQGPFLVVSNHFGKDTSYLLATLKNYDVHIGASETIHWQRSPFLRWLLKQFRMLPVPESLAHLSQDEKQKLLTRIPPGRIREQYTEIIEREKDSNGDTGKMQFIRRAVSLLSRGDVLVIYPEGLWLYEESRQSRAQTLYQAYEGMEVIARQYEALTKQELPILPIALYQEQGTRHMKIQPPLLLSQNDTALSGTDWCMSRIAQALPESQRGYYAQHFTDVQREPSIVK